MTALSLTSALKDDILVVGLAQGPAQRKGGKPSLIIESGDLALDTKSLEEILVDLGATGKADEVIKIPGNSVRLLVFTGLVAYDTQKVKRIGAGVEYGTATAGKLALMGALSLYLDFINLFLFLLRVFGGRRGE